MTIGVVEVQKLFVFQSPELPSEPNQWSEGYGQKAAGLVSIPTAWRPPAGILPSSFYRKWSEAHSADALARLEVAATEISSFARTWSEAWPRGIILRSSASTESLEDRGSLKSCRLAQDYSVRQINEAISTIFTDFRAARPKEDIAILVQPLVNEGLLGHLSNERRVSKTVNQWRLEITAPIYDFDNFNSQRDVAPELTAPLYLPSFSRKHRNRLFGAVGRWANSMHRGPVHFEWAYDGKCVWLLQLDYEMDTPDGGIDPRLQLRDTSLAPSSIPASKSAFIIEDLETSSWRKVANARVFRDVRKDPYPTLIGLTGEKLEEMAAQTDELARDLELFGHGRIVCRTDCRALDVPRENLPRTNTVNSAVAVSKMREFLENLKGKGARSEDVNFIIHKFIPARAGAWVKADPNSQIVEVNSLWGLPDGLQYMPYDTFEYDIKRKAITADKVRYKPKFVQEDAAGNWVKLDVKRSLARSRSLSSEEVAEIASLSFEIVSKTGQAALIMWFCGIPDQLRIGANLPWFRMPPGAAKVSAASAPRWPRRTLRSVEDIERAQSEDLSKTILLLDPEVDLIRDDTNFLQQIIRLAKTKSLPVEISGSTLAHAFYLLEKAGIAVFPTDETQRSRARSRRSYDKLVRDNIPQEIQEHGEVVLQSRLHKAELRYALVAKMFEEAQEFIAAVDPDDVKGELADLLEVVRSMAEVTGVDWSQVVDAADEKRRRRGGFGAGAVLVETAWPSQRRISSAVPSLMTLKHLGQVFEEAGDKIISFNALLADRQQGVEIEISGQKLFIELSLRGLRISRPINEGSAVQLSLFGEEDG